MSLKCIALVGSLRKGSYNRLLLRAALELKPADLEIEEFHIGQIPLYNEDLREMGFPPQVEALREKIRKADALLLITPEYNYSMSGVLKNAIDWASRPPDQPFNDKPAAIMGASGSILGTGRAQYHLRQTCVYLNLHVLNKPEVMIARAGDKFDVNGRLTDETARKLISELLANLAAWTRRLRARE
ncbi:MAG: NAD(P)H-dependent oxidoreductase [Gammaproteobacteria bacterium]|nr:NAD(P)H-dependent oxidoreductase [Gammaproteobacteria bacterium]